ncbi:uncharacterized protein BJ212DRAFT_1392540 [Suillus subaureus]|uniref:Uncharacterized protein n=1 Tax=Suillus subaureus TaxID=48587 RepID=A0A9P7DX81_9AGAM|nr:uncharacterized protein BJ212DRAFT_1392540 [Suillus subaureus]KAG1805179.1 hypothetical protein BJ212DRAFT_1392540 [Suillus subaureus]
MGAPRFAHCRLYLPCMVFRVTEIRRRRDPNIKRATNITYGIKADGLHELLIITEEKLVQFTPVRPNRQTVFLVLPWNRNLLEPAEFVEPPDFGDDTQSEDEYWSSRGSPFDASSGSSDGGQEPVDSEPISRALRLIVRLGQPFNALLLAQQFSGEYKRIASDCYIIAEVKDIASVKDMMDIRSLEIL